MWPTLWPGSVGPRSTAVNAYKSREVSSSRGESNRVRTQVCAPTLSLGTLGGVGPCRASVPVPNESVPFLLHKVALLSSADFETGSLYF